MSEEIPWKKFAVEGFVIVASILLAFGIDAWWQERQERQFEQEALVGLQEEYRGHRDMLARHKSLHDEIVRAVEILMKACERGYYEPDQIPIDRALYLSRLPPTADLGDGVAASLISSGRIEILSNRVLRHEITGWKSVLDELVDDQLTAGDAIMGLMIPYLTRNGIPLMSFTSPLGVTPNLPDGRSLAADNEAMQRLFSDPEYLSILESRYGGLVHTADELDRVIAAIDSILEEIDASLAN